MQVIRKNIHFTELFISLRICVIFLHKCIQKLYRTQKLFSTITGDFCITMDTNFIFLSLSMICFEYVYSLVLKFSLKIWKSNTFFISLKFNDDSSRSWTYVSVSIFWQFWTLLLYSIIPYHSSNHPFPLWYRYHYVISFIFVLFQWYTGMWYY